MTVAQLTKLLELETRASEAAQLLKLMANEKRLLILCHLIARPELTVGALAEAVGLSQSALSQHLTRLREDGLVAARRESQMMHYRIADPKAAKVLELLKDLFCPDIAAG
ncbi:MAG: ArsR/SmtB family transcription factor [Hyphomicrobiaceae bacterium]|jgi:DNA-binding transcriptional ArsR family regulator